MSSEDVFFYNLVPRVRSLSRETSRYQGTFSRYRKYQRNDFGFSHDGRIEHANKDSSLANVRRIQHVFYD